MTVLGIKRKTAFFLTLVFIYNTFGFLFIQPLLSIYFQHIGIQKAAEPSKEDTIELIVLKKDDIFLKKINFERIGSREFKLNNSMFDIYKEVEQDSFIYFYCISDEKEEELENEFQKRVEENATNKKQNPKDNNPYKILFSELVRYSNLNQMNPCPSVYKCYDKQMYFQICEDIPTPPPRSI
jgi:hypothetical protein